MSVHEEIKVLLNREKILYKLITHEPVFTSSDAARIRNSNISHGAKSLVLYANDTPILVVVPGDKKMDFKKFKREFNVKDLRLATPEEVTTLTTLQIGSIPPIGKVLGLQSYFDSSFLDKDLVFFNAGSLTISVQMQASDLISVEKPIISELV